MDKCDPFRYESTKALTSRPNEVETNRIVRQTFCAVTTSHFTAHNRSDNTVDIRESAESHAHALRSQALAAATSSSSCISSDSSSLDPAAVRSNVPTSSRHAPVGTEAATNRCL